MNRCLFNYPNRNFELELEQNYNQAAKIVDVESFSRLSSLTTGSQKTKKIYPLTSVKQSSAIL